MNIYHFSKIYKITNNINDSTYVGATTQKLKRRFSNHISECRNPALKQLINDYGKECLKIELIKEVSCENKKELDVLEKSFIKELSDMNKCIPLRSRAEHYQDNKEYILNRQHKYYLNNRETIREKVKEYRLKNDELIVQTQDREVSKLKDQIEIQHKRTTRLILAFGFTMGAILLWPNQDDIQTMPVYGWGLVIGAAVSFLSVLFSSSKGK